MKFTILFKNKILVSSIGVFTIAGINTLYEEASEFSISPLIIGFLVTYFFLWGYDNSEDEISN